MIRSRAPQRPSREIAALAITVLSVMSACNGAKPANATAHDSVATEAPSDCSALPDAGTIANLLKRAPDSGQVGGLFGGKAEWAATVNRKGQICTVVAPSDSAGGYWPGSRSIAMAKAFTANGFSTDTAAMSTARLYTFAQPGHSLYGAVQPEPFNPDCLDPTSQVKVCGGGIVFGGGLALYKNGKIIGGLGVSGDTPCADHEIAKRVRHMAGLDPKLGPTVDDIQYAKVDHASVYTHPLCPNTWRNGKKIGDEQPASGY
jgi:uncharacterized protein GlcG (DUF336 family)